MLEPPLERFKLSQAAKDQLTKLKRYTKIDQWNILCRWGFCLSLAESTPPADIPIPTDSNLELTWRIFAGDLSDLLILALKQRCYNDRLGVDRKILAHQFRLHLHRGITYLAGRQDLKSIEDMTNIVLPKTF